MIGRNTGFNSRILRCEKLLTSVSDRCDGILSKMEMAHQRTHQLAVRKDEGHSAAISVGHGFREGLGGMVISPGYLLAEALRLRLHDSPRVIMKDTGARFRDSLLSPGLTEGLFHD